MPQGNVRPTRVRLRTKKNPDGSQQYVRGNTNPDKINTLSTGQNEAYGKSERAYRSGDVATSSRYLRGALSLDKAQQEIAKQIIKARSRRKLSIPPR